MSAFLEAWFLPIGLLLAFGVLLLVPLLEAVTSSFSREYLHCPLAGGQVAVEFDERGRLGSRNRVDVRSCSAFLDSKVVGCGKHCLESGFASATQ